MSPSDTPWATNCPTNYSIPNNHISTTSMFPSPTSDVSSMSPHYPFLPMNIINYDGIHTNFQNQLNMQNYGSPSFVGQTYQFCNSRSAFLHQPSPLYPPSDLKGDLKLVKREYNENCSYSNTSSDDGIYHGKSQKANSRRYKTPSPQVLRSRRQAANQRERKRMNGLNDAFEQLRAVLPDTDTGRRYSKFETLHMAQIYMTQLHEILKNADTKEVSKK